MRKNGLFLLAVLIILPIGVAQCVPVTSTTLTNAAENTTMQTLTAVSIQIPTATLTLTPYLPLSSAEEQANIAALLRSNSGCSLPCWWMITPGETTKLAVKQISNTLNLNLIEYTQGFGKSVQFDFPEGALEAHFEFWIQQDYVKYVHINSMFYSKNPNTDTSTFKNIWANFRPEKIIPELGVPTRVKIYSAFSPGEGQTTGAFHDIYIFYDADGILLRYRVINDLASIHKVCLTFGNGGNAEASIEITLASPGDSTPIENYDEAYMQYFDGVAIPIEDAAGIPPEEFYSLFTQTGQIPCFNTLPTVFR